MINMLWTLIAWIVSRPRIAQALIKRAQKTPYYHLPGYMDRWWLLNGFPERYEDDHRPQWMRRLPSIRIHHILRRDHDRVPHDHPWNARTIILDGEYIEERNEKLYARMQGDTATLKYGEYHRIDWVSSGGVWTLFIVGRYRGPWGFLVDGVKVPWREYEPEKHQ